MDTDSFIVYMKTKDISVDIAKVVEKRSDISNYESERPLTRAKKKKKVVGLIKDELKKQQNSLHCFQKQIAI